MKKIILKIIPLLLLFSSFSYAQNFNLNSLDLDQIKSLISEADTDIPKLNLNKSKASLKEWTVMAYINGKNDLSEYGEQDVNEMETVGSTSKMNIVVELGTAHQKTERFLVIKDDYPTLVTSHPLEIMDKNDMGDWKHLVDFVSWSKEKFPAKRYMLIIWNHGNGWTTSKGISYDDETDNHISTPELGLAMKEIGKIDILAMDACLMQMAEVAFEVKDYADIVVASQETEPGNGYPFDLIFKKMAKMTKKSNEAIAKNIITQYEKYYSSKKDLTQSAVKTSKLDSLAALINDWVKTAMQIKDKRTLINALNETKSYDMKEYKDLSHFIKLAGEKTQDNLLIKKGKRIQKFIYKELIIANTGLEKNSNGISIHLTKNGTGKKYADLAWSRETQWDEFLNSIKSVEPLTPFEPDSACIDPGDDASIAELMDYVNCLTNALTSTY
ncbi:MAG: hypothetical protein KAI33_10590 [Elusimicrobiales bacterium]|nr:hypothetical protein [Elusimicrobiales bacterium]